MTGPKHRQVLIYFSRMLLHSPMTPALPCEGNGDINFVGNAHLKWGGEAGCTRRGPFPINKFPRQYGRNVWNPGIMAQAAPAFTAAAYYIMDSASELLRTTMPTNDEVRVLAAVRTRGFPADDDRTRAQIRDRPHGIGRLSCIIAAGER
jgi:hypothetical protein